MLMRITNQLPYLKPSLAMQLHINISFYFSGLFKELVKNCDGELKCEVRAKSQ